MARHPIVHFEVYGHDRTGLATFYRDTFDWEVRDEPEMQYTFVTVGEDTPTGGGLADAADGFTGSMIYIESPDIHASVARCVELGADLVRPVMTIPGTVTMAVLTDPQGNRFGLVAETVHEA